MADPFVHLCDCWDLVEAGSIRSSLQARGVRVLIEGEHHRGMMGMLGAAIALRVMVPASQLDRARELAAELIPDLAPEPTDDDEWASRDGFSPARRPLADDRLDEDAPVFASDEDDEPELPRRKSMAVALLVTVCGFAVGTLHMYAGWERLGVALFLIAAFGAGGFLTGQPWGAATLFAVWAIDASHGLVLLYRFNRAIDAQAKPSDRRQSN